jgi:signal transduction histidine kinase
MAHFMNGRQDRAYLQTPEQWTRFLSAFVHEIRTPIASFRMLADLLAEASPDAFDDPQKRYTENMREVAQEIQTLLGEVAELALLLEGRAIVRPIELALEPLVDQVEEAVRPLAWDRGVVLSDSLAAAVPRRIHSDPDRLRQALVLLLGAVVSQARTEVFLRLDVAGGDLRIEISSDGPPLSEAALRSPFEPFQDGLRAGRARGGRSLALPLARELAHALGGSLRAGNRDGKPLFSLSLPAAAPPVP